MSSAEGASTATGGNATAASSAVGASASIESIIRHTHLLLPDLVSVISEISNTSSGGAVGSAATSVASSSLSSSSNTASNTSSSTTSSTTGAESVGGISGAVASSSVKAAMDAFKSRWTQLYQAVEALPGIDWSHAQQLEMLTTLQQKLIKKNEQLEAYTRFELLKNHSSSSATSSNGTQSSQMAT
eukprot:TRINITY_DN12011_c0_g1_i1.p1 TRINITY_DN12011_c0_g1~~TRINITY_DN12011_c0_g1_i1.p1  ORF type:complete len:186 (+),score=35.48 TRINITY_DN12011_c0_g1_i1:1-558(+)